MVCEINRDKLKELEGIFRDCGLGVKGHKLIKEDDHMVCIIDAYGALDNHERVMERLFAESEVKEFHY
jgi:hypothetical protein